jgi:uncharacterized protein YbjT (DUF2867 family)
MKILITGASGNFGSRATRSLLQRVPARDLILISRKPERLAEFTQAGCEVRYGDFDAPQSIEQAARGAEKMLLISGHKVGHRVKQHGDAIEAAKSAGVKHENRIYNITGTELWTFKELAELATRITGRPIEYVRVSDEALYVHLDSMGIPRNALQEFNVDGYAWCSDDMVSYEREVRNGRFAITSNDIHTLLGRAPKSFRAFAEERADRLRAIAAGG